MMKKLLAILLSAIMLLGCCACAEGVEFKIGGIQINTSDDFTLDLSEIDLRLAAAANENALGLRLALDSNEVTALSGVATISSEGIALTADGLSKTYVITAEEIEMILSAILESIFSNLDLSTVSQLTLPSLEDLTTVLAAVLTELEVVMNSMTDAGVEEYDGLTYQNYTLTITEENVNNCVLAICQFLDKYPQITGSMAAEVGFESTTELWEALDPGISVNAELSISEEDVIGDFYLCIDGTQILDIFLYAVTTSDAENATTSKDVYVTFNVVDENGDNTEVLDINGCLTLQDESEAFYSYDGYITVPVDEETDAGIFFGLYSPAETGTGLSQFVITDWNDAFSFNLSLGESDGVTGLYGALYAEESEIGFFVEGAAGAGSFGASIADAQFGAELLGEFGVAPVDDAWLNVDTSNTVSILNMTSEDVEALSGEAMMLALGAAAQLAAGNEVIMSMISSMLG